MRNLLAFWVWKSNAVQVHSIKLYLHSFATVSTKIFVVDVWILPSFLQFYRSWSFFSVWTKLSRVSLLLTNNFFFHYDESSRFCEVSLIYVFQLDRYTMNTDTVFDELCIGYSF